jgi:hypothetical protein
MKLYQSLLSDIKVFRWIAVIENVGAFCVAHGGCKDGQLSDVFGSKPFEDLTGLERCDFGVLGLIDSWNATGSHLSIAPIPDSRFLESSPATANSG